MRRLTPKQGIIMLATLTSTVMGSRLIAQMLRASRVMRTQQYVEDFKKLQDDTKLTIGPRFMEWWDTEVAPTLPVKHDEELWNKAFFLAVHAYLHEKEQRLFHTLRAMLSRQDYEQNMRMHQTEMDGLRNTVSRYGIDPVKIETQFAIA